MSKRKRKSPSRKRGMPAPKPAPRKYAMPGDLTRTPPPKFTLNGYVRHIPTGRRYKITGALSKVTAVVKSGDTIMTLPFADLEPSLLDTEPRHDE